MAVTGDNIRIKFYLRLVTKCHKRRLLILTLYGLFFPDYLGLAIGFSDCIDRTGFSGIRSGVEV